MGKIERLAKGMVALVAGSLLVAGCGAKPSTVVDASKQIKDLKINQPSQGGAGVPTGLNQQAFLQQLMQDITQVRNTTNSLQFDLTGYFIAIDTGQPASNKVHYCFEKPNKTSINILQSTDDRTVGTKLVWLGGSDVQVHTKFIGFWINTSVSERDSRMTDQRGYYLDQTGITPTMDLLLNPQNQVTLGGFGNMNGIPVCQLDIASPKQLQGISHEVFTIDGNRKVPIMREMYDQNNKLVFRIRMDNVILNGTLPSDTFKL